MFKKIREQLKRRDTLFPYRVKDHAGQTQATINALEIMIDEHDCHITPQGESGCDCSEWRERLQVLTGKQYH